LKIVEMLEKLPITPDTQGFLRQNIPFYISPQILDVPMFPRWAFCCPQTSTFSIQVAREQTLAIPRYRKIPLPSFPVPAFSHTKIHFAPVVKLQSAAHIQDSSGSLPHKNFSRNIDYSILIPPLVGGGETATSAITQNKRRLPPPITSKMMI